MQTHKKGSKGFTLIELLIVVLIIAILAAIALPNFMEFQTRAKVARVKSDFRSLATAQEAYAVEWGSYCCTDRGDDQYYVEGFRQLTTPVAYISTIPNDPFDDHRWPLNNSYRWSMYEMGTGNSHNRERTNDPDHANPAGFPADCWFMSSAGPDNQDTTHSQVPGGGSTFRLSEGYFPWNNLPDNDAAVEAILSLQYDPTNGTHSLGQVYRVGGSIPEGRPYTILWDNWK